MKKPLHGGPIRGSDNPTITQSGYNGNIPIAAFNALEQEAGGLIHGVVTLALHFKDGKLNRYVTNRERSHIPGKPTTGGEA